MRRKRRRRVAQRESVGARPATAADDGRRGEESAERAHATRKLRSGTSCRLLLRKRLDASTLVVESNNNKEKEISSAWWAKRRRRGDARAEEPRRHRTNRRRRRRRSLLANNERVNVTFTESRFDVVSDTVMQRPEDDPDAAARSEETSTMMMPTVKDNADEETHAGRF